jgi:hypothetical protein
MLSKLTPWQRIIRAAKEGKGIRLSADEVYMLSQDDAIEQRARNDDEGESEDRATAEGYIPPWQCVSQ